MKDSQHHNSNTQWFYKFAKPANKNQCDCGKESVVGLTNLLMKVVRELSSCDISMGDSLATVI